jgi:hypothetical protein
MILYKNTGKAWNGDQGVQFNDLDQFFALQAYLKADTLFISQVPVNSSTTSPVAVA